MIGMGGGGASNEFSVLEGRIEKRQKEEEKETEWGLVDFLGKYHKHIIKSGNPIPGTAVACDERRERKWTDRLDRIRGPPAGGVRARFAAAAARGRARAQAGSRTSRTGTGGTCAGTCRTRPSSSRR